MRGPGNPGNYQHSHEEEEKRKYLRTILAIGRLLKDNPQITIEEIKTLLLGVIDARGKVLLSMNVPAGCLEAVISALPAMKKPTISQLYNSDYLEVTTVVEKTQVNLLVPELKAQGAEDILELAISKIVK